MSSLRDQIESIESLIKNATRLKKQNIFATIRSLISPLKIEDLIIETLSEYIKPLLMTSPSEYKESVFDVSSPNFPSLVKNSVDSNASSPLIVHNCETVVNNCIHPTLPEYHHYFEQILICTYLKMTLILLH